MVAVENILESIALPRARGCPVGVPGVSDAIICDAVDSPRKLFPSPVAVD